MMGIAKLFAEEKVNNKELLEALQRMLKQLESVGGQLTFDFKIDNDGWVAVCKEFDGITAGGSSKNPSEEEVMRSLIESIKTAFDVPINRLEIKKGELQKLQLPKIKVVREFQLC